MPLKAVPHIFLPDPTRLVTQSTLTMSSTRKYSCIFMVPKSGTITKIGFRCVAVTTSQTVRVGIETVSTTTGFHTTTQYGGSAVGTVTPTANTFHEVTLATPATAVQGDVVAAIIQWDGAGGDITISTMETVGYPWDFPYMDEETGGVGAKIRRWPSFSIGYSDGTYPDCGGYPMGIITQVSYDNASSPDERALSFSLPFPTRIIGCNIRNTVGTSADFDMVLYAPDGVTALATQSIDGNQWQGTGADHGRIFFDAPVNISRNTRYRLSLKPTTTNNPATQEFSTSTVAMMEQTPGGTGFYLSTRTDAGAWTDTTTRVPMFSLILDRIHDGFVQDYHN